jgi:hypothetical protein
MAVRQHGYFPGGDRARPCRGRRRSMQLHFKAWRPGSRRTIASRGIGSNITIASYLVEHGKDRFHQPGEPSPGPTANPQTTGPGVRAQALPWKVNPVDASATRQSRGNDHRSGGGATEVHLYESNGCHWAWKSCRLSMRPIGSIELEDTRDVTHPAIGRSFVKRKWRPRFAGTSALAPSTGGGG